MTTPNHGSLTDNEVLAWFHQEYDRPFAGWDFSYLRGRRHHLGDKPWDYESLTLHRGIERTGAPIDIGFHLFVLVAQNARE